MWQVVLIFHLLIKGSFVKTHINLVKKSSVSATHNTRSLLHHHRPSLLLRRRPLLPPLVSAVLNVPKNKDVSDAIQKVAIAYAIQ